ncbi:MAG TPA: hypothetical protein VJT71_17970 [Pyrinomonadaceae bacterium]|nr:hypothetical protein [Pyrinomonadaceae bacterium]
MSIEHFKSDDEIRALVESFEACSFHPSEFRHYQHLAVALWYVRNLTAEDALTRMTCGIRRLAETYGKTGYHETITVFWLRIVSEFSSKADDKSTLGSLANELIERCHDKDLIFDYYSRGLLESPRAKAEWVEPDLKKL